MTHPFAKDATAHAKSMAKLKVERGRAALAEQTANAARDAAEITAKAARVVEHAMADAYCDCAINGGFNESESAAAERKKATNAARVAMDTARAAFVVADAALEARHATFIAAIRITKGIDKERRTLLIARARVVDGNLRDLIREVACFIRDAGAGVQCNDLHAALVTALAFMSPVQTIAVEEPIDVLDSEVDSLTSTYELLARALHAAANAGATDADATGADATNVPQC
jgi:hypothetical protein